MMQQMAICDECESSYVDGTSAMASLCPECAHRLYGYPPCEHEMVAVEAGGGSRCRRCGWDGVVSDYLKARK